MARKNLGTLTVDMVAKMGGFVDGMSKAERAAYKSMRGVKKEVSGADKAVRVLNKGVGLLAGAIAGLAGTTVAMVRSQANSASETLKMAERFGMTTEELTKMRYAAQMMSGMAEGNFDTAMRRMIRRVSEAAQGGGTAAKAIQELGLDARELAEMQPEEVFKQIADAMQGVERQNDKLRMAFSIFDTDGANLINTLDGGRVAIEGYGDELERFGGVLDSETAQAASDFNDALDKVKKSLFGNYELLTALTPTLEDFTDLLSDPQTMESLRNMVTGVADLAMKLLQVSAEAANFSRWLGEAVAEYLHGPDNLLDREIKKAEELEKKLARLRQPRNAPNTGMAGGGFAFLDKGSAEQIAQVEAELNEVLATIEELRRQKAFQEEQEAIKRFNDELAKAEAGTKAVVAGSVKLDSTLKKQESAWAAVADEIARAQGYWNEFGFWENNEDPFADYSESAEKAVQSVGSIERSYSSLGGISSGVMRGLVYDAENAFDQIPDMFKGMLAQMADDALRNQINIQFGAEGSTAAGDGGGGMGAMAAGGWWAVIAVAAVAAVGEWNSQQDEKFAALSSEVRQAGQGTGTLLGSLNEKSQSLNNVIAELEANSSDALDVNWGMLRTLQDIRTGLMGVAEGFARTGFGFEGSGAFGATEFGSTLANATERHGIWTPTESGTLVSMGLEHNILAAQERYGINRSHVTGNPLDYLLEESGAFGIDEFALGFFDGVAESIAKNIYRERTSLVDSGIEVFGGTLADIIDGGLVDAQAYADISKERKLFGVSISKDIETLYEQLDEQTRKQLTGVYLGAFSALAGGAETFGIDIADALPRLVLDSMRLSLEGLEPDELAAEIESFFSSQFDEWAQIVLGGTDVLRDYQRVGEGAFETMMRLSAETEYYTDIVDRLGFNFDAVGMSAVTATQAVAEAAGGFDNLTSNLQRFISNFVSSEQQVAMITDQLTDVFDRLGEVLPATREGFYDLVSSIDQTTAEGAKLFAELIGLSGPMSDYLSALEKEEQAKNNLANQYASKEVELMRLQGDEAGALALQRELELEAMDESLRAIQEKIWAEQDLAAAILAATVAEEKRSSFLQGVNDAILDFISPAHASLSRLNQAMESQIATAQELGFTEDELANMRRLHQLQLLDFAAGLEQSLMSLNERLFGSLDADMQSTARDIGRNANEIRESLLGALEGVDAWLQRSMLSSVSPLTPEERLREAESQFFGQLPSALGGDADAISGMAALADQLLSEASGFYGGSTAEFDDIWLRVREAMQRVSGIDVPDAQPTYEQQAAIVSATEATALSAYEETILATDMLGQIAALARVTEESPSDIAERLGIPMGELIDILGYAPDATAGAMGDQFDKMVSGFDATLNPLLAVQQAQLDATTKMAEDINARLDRLEEVMLRNVAASSATASAASRQADAQAEQLAVQRRQVNLSGAANRIGQ